MAQASETSKAPELQRFDPWAGHKYGGLSWFAFSTAAHVALLFAFATVTLTVIRKVEEIRVKVIDEAANTEALEAEDGAPSLRDLAGVLKMEKAMPQRAAPAGPKIQGVRAPELPRIGGIGPKLGEGPMVDTAATTLALGTGFGATSGGAIGGLGGGFGDYVGGLRKIGLDIVLVIDTTDSMQFVIDQVKERLSQMVGSLQRMVPTARVGIVVYRDKGEDYVVRWSDLSFHTRKLQDFLSNITASGGGNWEEAVKEGLDAAINEMKWRKQAKRIIILVEGSPPHPADVPDVDIMVREFRAAGGYVSAIDVIKRQHEAFEKSLWETTHGKEPFQPSPMPAFYGEIIGSMDSIAKQGGGEVIALDENKTLLRSVLEIAFGSRWKVELNKFLKELT